MSTTKQLMRYNIANKNGIAIQSNYSNLESLKKAVENGNKDPYVLFIKSYDNDIYDVSPAFHQGYTLEQTKELRDYLNNLISITEPIIKQA